MRIAEHTCPPEDIMAYLDGELQPVRAAAVQAHLAECAICQAVASDLRQVSTDLASWHAPGTPDALSAPRATRHVTPSRPWLRWARSPAWALGFAAAGLVLIVAAVWFEELASPKMSVSHEPAASVPPRATASRAGGGQGAPERALMAQAAIQPSAAPGQAGTMPDLPRAQKIVRTANLAIVTPEFEKIRQAIDGIVREVGGFVGQIQVSDAGSARSLNATLRVPASRLDDAVRQLRAFGRVVDERQSGDDVTEQVLDLEARLSNARNTERRLNEVLKTRTGNVRDVLEVEREIARVRAEIEQLDAQRMNLERRVTYATVTLQVTEQRQATLDIGPQSVRSRLRNAFVDGLQGAYESAVGVLLLALRAAPALVLWTAVLWWPARAVFRMVRAREAVARGNQGA